MNTILLIIGAVILAGVLFAVSARFNGSYRPDHFADKDRDGEPDEPGGPAKDL